MWGFHRYGYMGLISMDKCEGLTCGFHTWMAYQSLWMIHGEVKSLKVIDWELVELILGHDYEESFMLTVKIPLYFLIC